MPWFKVDDSFDTHAKAIRAGNQALGLWVRCGAYSARHLTDGFVPAEIAKLYGRAGEMRALVDAGLWKPIEGGYQMHDFHDYNPSSSQVRADRKAAAERQRRARDAAASRRDRSVSNGVSNAEVRGESRSPRPDPTGSSFGTSQRTRGQARSTTDERVRAGLDLAAKYDELEATEQPLRVLPGGVS